MNRHAVPESDDSKDRDVAGKHLVGHLRRAVQ